jgi:hypothetical protein
VRRERSVWRDCDPLAWAASLAPCVAG